MEQQERQEKRLRAALRMAEVLRREARHFADLPPGLRPEKLAGAGKQFNEFVNWMQQELGIRLPFSPLPDDPDPTTLSLAATQLVGALQVLIGEEVVEEPKERKREPVLRIREQKSPVEFSELVITSAEELAELLRTGLPEWIKSVVAKATEIAEKAVSKATEEVERTAQTVQIECEEEKEEAGAEKAEQLEELGEHIEELTEELAEVEEELAEAAEEGYLTEELKAQLEAKKARIKQKLRETLRALQHALGK
jgi:vacuolar-type H+-ATPase subunit I/STV1